LENVVVYTFKVAQRHKEIDVAAVVCMKSALAKSMTIKNEGKVFTAVPVGER
jgi:hypothetical protein